MAQLGGLSYIRAICKRKAQTAAYIKRELDHLYECGLYKMRSARSNGSRLIRDLSLVFVLVVIAIARNLA